jgi:PadR family transcriptional regulator, regulatory protein PadR
MSATPMGPLQGTLELLILKSLEAGGEMHGFAILDWMRRTTADEIVVEDGALYHALHRMRKRGWVTAEWGISDKGRRARYYGLTPKGRTALDDEAAQWSRYVAAVARITGAEPV